MQTWCHISTAVMMNINLKSSSSITAIKLVDNTDEMQTYQKCKQKQSRNASMYSNN